MTADARDPDQSASEPTAPRHPARRATSIDGRSPGSRVSAFAAFPGVSQWLFGSGSPLTVAGAAADFGRSALTAFPVPLIRETVDTRPLKAASAAFVNAARAWARALAKRRQTAIVLRVVGSRMVRDVKGNAVRVATQFRGCPRNCKRRAPFHLPLEPFAPGRPKGGIDPRARRPAAGINLSRALGWRARWGIRCRLKRPNQPVTAPSRPLTLSRAIPIFAAALLGMFIVGGVGFSHIEAVHNAAHDYRHSMAFPCH